MIALMFVPFMLQILGWARTPLGGGPCGVIGLDQMLIEQPQAFFYAQIMLWGICLLMATGFFLIMLSFMNNGEIPTRQALPFLQITLFISVFISAIYLLTHTTGLPSPSALGWLWGSPESWDVIGILVLVVMILLVWLGARWFTLQKQPESAPISL